MFLLTFWGGPGAGNGTSRPKWFFCAQQFRKMTVKVPENRPGKFRERPEKVPGLSRVIFKVTEGLTFGTKAFWLANFLAKSLKFVLELVCIGKLVLELVCTGKFVLELVCTGDEMGLR